ncbi:SDR family oxidoreductase [Archangium violaceum]|uniref:Epimerase n=1 Tax=Archangium violaceum Cb vi76 TaxID=1406225 RepID=A0A084STX5_9BACT|nr:SDR family oxidoreductase [Archangium violaceum]KFA91910.1 epimerase [Archangium violaceum Cb vi76]
MTTSRRQFLQYTLAAAAMTACATGTRSTSGDGRAASKKKILILGGTGFLGPAVVAAAQARGHTLTLFNRGKTRPELFPDVEKLQGDRDPNKGEGLKALEGRSFDAVIDNSGYYPRMVGASASLLAPNVGQYIFISSGSAYAKNDTPGADETAATATLADPTVESMGKNFENYGGLKRACEVAVEKALPGRTTIVRPGYIVGPEDRTDRFTYFPWRYAQGGEMLAPGSPSDPLQIIDVRDLAEWLVLLVERNTTGVFNAVGPEKPWSMGELFTACKEITGKDTKLTWVSGEFLQKNGEDGEGALPIWAPAFGSYAGMHRRSNARAVQAGLKFRSPVVTTRDTLEWFNSQPEERRSKLRGGLPPEREAELLSLWAKAQQGTPVAPSAQGG